MEKVTAIDFGQSRMHIIREKGTIIVDTGRYTEKKEYEEKFSELGIDPKDVTLIILTHGHFDHCARIGEIIEITGAPVLCHKNAVNFLKTGEFDPYVPRGEEGKKFIELISDDVLELPVPTDPDIVVEDKEFDLNPYGVAGKIIYTPGHVDSSISVVLDSGEAIIGDMILTSPFTGNTTLALLADDEPALKDSIRKLIDNGANLFYGGHGGPYSKEDVEALL